MDSLDFLLWLTLLFLFIAVLLMGVAYQGKVHACEEFGGRLSGSFTCIKGVYHYDVIPKHPFSLYEHQVVIKPVEEKNE